MSLPKTALISVYDKSGLAPLARQLADLGITIISSGGTHKHLTNLGFAVREIADLTSFPEILDGRVKTLHPAVHGGLLAKRDDPEHMATIAEHGIAPIDLFISNLYPFNETVASGADFAACIEQIDVGGPAMIRAAAKNHAGVLVVTSPDDYADLSERLANPSSIDAAYRQSLALKAFTHIAAYDSAISNWLQAQTSDALPARLTVASQGGQTLRYGENPHQRAAFYPTAKTGFAGATLHQGKALSYNNLVDADAAWSLVNEFSEPAAAIIKHANPSGCAQAASVLGAYENALKSDPVSAFGGIVAANRTLDREAAEAITKIFTEVVIAPDVSPAALEVFAAKPNLRLLSMAQDDAAKGIEIKTIAGGVLLQDRDNAPIDAANFKCVTDRQPTADELNDLIFAFKLVRHIKSNAIVLVRDQAITGVGAGQMSRIDSVKIASARAAQHGLAGPCVLASDAFFPFADGLEAAVQAGITAAIQPGGSKRDDEVIEFANKAGIAMLFTGQRHFWH